MRRFVTAHLLGLLLSREQLRQPALRSNGFYFILTIYPCVLWAALNAMDKYKAVECVSIILYFLFFALF
jgi:hypothetical protein